MGKKSPTTKTNLSKDRVQYQNENENIEHIEHIEPEKVPIPQLGLLEVNEIESQSDSLIFKKYDLRTKTENNDDNHSLSEVNGFERSMPIWFSKDQKLHNDNTLPVYDTQISTNYGMPSVYKEGISKVLINNRSLLFRNQKDSLQRDGTKKEGKLIEIMDQIATATAINKSIPRDRNDNRILIRPQTEVDCNVIKVNNNDSKDYMNENHNDLLMNSDIKVQVKDKRSTLTQQNQIKDVKLTEKNMNLVHSKNTETHTSIIEGKEKFKNKVNNINNVDKKIFTTYEVQIDNKDLIKNAKEKKSGKSQIVGISKNFVQIEQIIKGQKLGNHFTNMIEYNKRLGLQEKTKIFCFNSQDEHIRRALKRFGWFENCIFPSTLFDLKWGYNDCENDYRSLMQGQYYNHFLNNQCITTKSGLNERLRNMIEHGIDIFDFFPRCFDLGVNRQIEELVEDYERTSLIILIRKHWIYFKNSAVDKVNEVRIRYKTKEKLRLEVQKKGLTKKKKNKKNKKPYFYEEFVKNDNFIVHIDLLEIIFNCIRFLVRQYKELNEDDQSNFPLKNLDKDSISLLMKYSYLKPSYHLLTKEERVFSFDLLTRINFYFL